MCDWKHVRACACTAADVIGAPWRHCAPQRALAAMQDEDAAELLCGAVQAAARDVRRRGHVSVIMRVHSCQPWWGAAEGERG